MKKINKKGAVLLEAVIALTIGIFILGFLLFIGNDFKKMNSASNENLTLLQVEKFKNELNFLKNRLISIGNLTQQYNNNKFYGWDTLKITNAQSLNELNGYYILSHNGICDSGMDLCLEEVTDTGYSNSFLIGGNIRYKDENGKIEIKDNYESNYYSDNCDEGNETCLKYRFFIEDFPTDGYEQISYTESNGNLKILNNKKKVTIEVQGFTTGEIKKINYILSLY